MTRWVVGSLAGRIDRAALAEQEYGAEESIERGGVSVSSIYYRDRPFRHVSGRFRFAAESAEKPEKQGVFGEFGGSGRKLS